jgi:hypothetical protein
MCAVERFKLRPGTSADHPALDRSTKFIGGMFDRYPARNQIAQRSKRATPRPPVGVENLFEFGTTDAVTWDRGCANPVARKHDLRHFAEMLAARIKRILPTARAVPPSPASLAFLAKHGVSSKIVRALSATSVSAKTIPFGRISIASFSDLPKINKKPNQAGLAHGFLVIGEGPTGDLVALELADAKVAYLSHSALWEDPLFECAEFSDAVVRSGLELVTFLTLAEERPDFPADFYAAGGL